MFLLVPLFALLMRMFFWAPPRRYVEHLVFVLHLQSAAFLAMGTTLLLKHVLGDVSWGWVLLGCATYALLALRGAYGQSWPMTLVKGGVLGFAYVMSALSTMTGLVMAGIWFA